MSLASFGILILLAALWGASFLFIKIAVTDIGPMTYAMFRVLVGAITLLLVIVARRTKLPKDRRVWAHFCFMGAVGILVPFAAISWGTQYIDSGLSAILNAAMPLFTFLLSLAIGDDSPTVRRILGLLVGFAGILVLTWPQLGGGLQTSLLGELAVVLAALSYAIAILYARRKLSDQQPLVASLGQVSMGFLFLLPLGLLEQPWTQTYSLKVVGAILASGVLGTGLAYILYYRLLKTIGATGTSLVTYVVPLFGVFWGWAILNERLSWNAFAALLLILCGMLLVNNVSLRRRPPLTPVED